MNTATADQAAPDTIELLRNSTYRLLGGLLAASPAAELLASIATAPGETDGPEDPIARAWRALQQAARQADPDQLAHEFNDLFIGLGRGELVPYGSWYRTGMLMEEPLVALRADLSRLGFEVSPDVREPEDHAAALLETMYLLLQGGLDYAEQKQFYSRHLAPWLGKFFQDLSANQSSNFYQRVGDLGSAFMKLEQEYFVIED